MIKCIRFIQLLLWVTLMFVSNASADQPYNDDFESYSGTDGLAGATCFYMVFNHFGDHDTYTKSDCITEVDLSAKLTTVTTSSGVAQLINGGSTAGTSWSQLKNAAESLFKKDDCETKYTVELNSNFTEYNDSQAEEERSIRLEYITENYLNKNKPVIIHMMRYWYYPGTYVVLTGHENGRVYYARANGVKGSVTTDAFIKEKWYDPTLATKARWDGEWMGFYPNVMEPGDYRYQFSYDGYQRFYNLHIPDNSNYDGVTPLPLVLSFHGTAQNADNHRRYTRLNTVANDNNFLAVYPDGTSSAIDEDMRAWNPVISPYFLQLLNMQYMANVDDTGFVLEMIARISAQTPIDPQKIYVTGLSLGASMALKCIYEHPDVFAAASVGSGEIIANDFDFFPEGGTFSTPIPIQSIYTDNDPLNNGSMSEAMYVLDEIFDALGVELSPNFNEDDWDSVFYMERSMKRWAVANGCCDSMEMCEPMTETTIDGDTDSHYGPCNGGVDVNVIELLGLERTFNSGHDLYSYENESREWIDNTVNHIDISPMQWEFLSQYPIDTP